MPRPCPAPPAPPPLPPQHPNGPPQAFKTSLPSSPAAHRLRVGTMQLNFRGLPALVTGAGKGTYEQVGVREGPRWRVRWPDLKPHRPVLGSVSPSMPVTALPASACLPTTPRPRVTSTTQQAAPGQDTASTWSVQDPPPETVAFSLRLCRRGHPDRVSSLGSVERSCSLGPPLAFPGRPSL